MNTTKSLEILYDLALTAVGPDEAKQTLSGIITAVITELEDADLPVSDENISLKLGRITHEFLKAASRHSA
ncbi:MAG TPA: hypothetical protein VNJ08_02680 [Bacteriovoracaceae bacterium]|nr:hypothetical protein [Bacteriovoracaceae bacterium]